MYQSNNCYTVIFNAIVKLINILYILLYKTAFRVVLAEGLTCSHSEHRS